MHNITSHRGNKLFKNIHRMLLIATTCANTCIWGADETYPTLNRSAFIINKKAYCIETAAIHNATTVELAEPLLAKHALEHLNASQIQKLINQLAWPHYSPDLIPLYKQYGLNVMVSCGNYGYTLLMNLTIWPRQKPEIVKKAELLLEGLTIAQVKQYLAIKNHHNRTIFDLIDHLYSHSHSQELYALRNFLRQRTDPVKYPDNSQTVTPQVEKQPEIAIPECSVCLQPLDEQICTTTACNHIFHTGCLSVWANQNHSCPLCRTLV